jgi:hypothetical protein
MTDPVAAKLVGLVGAADSNSMTGLDLVVTVFAVVTAVNGSPPDDGQIATALAEEGLASAPSDVAEVRRRYAAGGGALGALAETEDDASWGEPIEDLPAELRDRLGIGAAPTGLD